MRARRMQRFYRQIMWRFGTKDEEALNPNIRECLVSLGDTMAADKKLYYFTGYDVLVRVTKTKGIGL